MKKLRPQCDDLVSLKAHDGAEVDVIGRYVFPKEKAFARTRLRLKDDTLVTVAVPREGAFGEENDGKLLAVTGKIFTGEIPPSYKIFGRTPDPYLLDVAGAEVVTP